MHNQIWSHTSRTQAQRRQKSTFSTPTQGRPRPHLHSPPTPNSQAPEICKGNIGSKLTNHAKVFYDSHTIHVNWRKCHFATPSSRRDIGSAQLYPLPAYKSHPRTLISRRAPPAQVGGRRDTTSKRIASPSPKSTQKQSPTAHPRLDKQGVITGGKVGGRKSFL